MFRIIPFFVLCLVASVLAEITSCGSESGDYTNVSISGCEPTDSQCILTRGTNASIEIDFKIKHPIQSVKAIVHGIIAGVPIPFPISHPNACGDSGLNCPLSDDKKIYSYKASLPVEKIYPTIVVDVKWQLQDESGKDIVCIQIPARIK